MLSHFSVARIKDKTAPSSLNHLLFSAAVALPPAQRSYCQDLHVGNSQRSFTHSHGLPSDFTRRRSRARCSARRRRPACGTGFVPGEGHGSARASGHAERSLPGSAACCSAARGSPGWPLPCSQRWRLSYFKAGEDVFRPVQTVPEDTWQSRSLSTLPHFLTRQSWGVFS